MKGKVEKVTGALVVAKDMLDAKMFDVVKVTTLGLVGEIIELKKDRASIQVYENTQGIKVGDVVENTGLPLSIELGPGLIGKVFDGIGRSLSSIYEISGDRIIAGVNTNTLDHEKKWKFIALKKPQDEIEEGDVLGYVQETGIIKTKILVPNGVFGKLTSIKSGEFNITQTVAKIKTKSGIENISMMTTWPIRNKRPFKKKLQTSVPLITGQRVIDTLFPIACGGVAAVPGPFGSGKTVVQHQLAKWSNADVVVYVGCGERGNEMTDVLNEFEVLLDPRTKKKLLEKTILIANTSDMPVAAREASIYTGITIAEYFRDMGYNAIIMADSTSRWAEALREMSGRLEEMPGEEGYPAYLSSKIASFYERAGICKVLGKEERIGSVTAIGAVSPHGGDLSEPVSQATLRVVKVFWGLSSALAYKRHFPAIDWLVSYSGYSQNLLKWYQQNVSYDFVNYKNLIMKTLQEEAEIKDVLELVGFDVLSDKDKITLEVAEIIREDFLHQNAFDETDTFTSIQKQNKMLKCVCDFLNLARKAIQDGISYEDIIAIPSKQKIAKMKYTKEDELEKLDKLCEEIEADFAMLEVKEENQS